MGDLVERKAKRLASGVYQVMGLVWPIYIVKDTASRRRWGVVPEWDVVTPFLTEPIEDIELPVGMRKMRLLFSADSKSDCLERLKWIEFATASLPGSGAAE